MSLSIIIVNYKTTVLIKDCLDSLIKNTLGISYNIIVVDNDSRDEIEIMLKEHFPDVKFILMGYNAGFARANNAGIRYSQAGVVLLLNSDTILDNNAIGNCYTQFIQSPYIACGVQLLNEDRTPQISGNYFIKGGVNVLLPLPYTGSFLSFLAKLFRVKKPNVPEAKGIVEVDWINGAFLMVKYNAIQAAGLLDEDFFLYAEEAEWCYRLKRIGKLCIYGDEHVIHLQGISANEEFNSIGKGYYNLYDKKGFQIMVSNFLRIRKQFGIGWLLFNLIFYVITVPVFGFGLLFAKIIFQNRSRYSFQQLGGFTINVFYLARLIPKMISSKPYFYKML